MFIGLRVMGSFRDIGSDWMIFVFFIISRWRFIIISYREIKLIRIFRFINYSRGFFFFEFNYNDYDYNYENNGY